MQKTFRYILVVVLILFTGITTAQHTKKFVLSNSLSEISGLALINDTTLIAINDGGNAARLFVLETNGRLRKTVKITNAENKDWEDLASDGTYLYIGDIGNNNNRRDNLCVYKVKISAINELNEVQAEKISFNYKEQSSFPPQADQRNFDAEGMVCYKDEIWLFTKSSADPWTGNSFLYSIPKTPGNYTLTKQQEVFIGNEGWWADAITGVDVLGDVFYFLTYNRISKMNFAKNEFHLIKNIPFDKMTQKEAIVIKNERSLFVADEKQPLLGGGNLYKMTFKK